jgi:hypothetical protein
MSFAAVARGKVVSGMLSVRIISTNAVGLAASSFELDDGPADHRLERLLKGPLEKVTISDLLIHKSDTIR